MRAPAFRLVPPAADEIPVLVEVPHAGLAMDAAFAAGCTAPARALARDADLYVDELYEDAPLEGASLLVAEVSRYVVDLNRAETDLDPDVVEEASEGPRFNHGLVWRVTSDGEPALARPLRPTEVRERLDTIYHPYHQALRGELERKRARFGYAVLLAAHSMPSTSRTGGGERGRRADVVPGSRGRTSASAAFIDAVEAHAVERGWTVRHDAPYAGGFSTQHYGRPYEGLHAVQVELSRRLYLDELTLRRSADFPRARAWCRALVRRLGQAASPR